MANALSLVGMRFGKLTVVSRGENNSKGNTMWNCLCDCGNHKMALGYDLTHGRTTSCGCNKGKHDNHIDMTGYRCGRLTVVGKAPKTQSSRMRWLCLCDCGKLIDVDANNLRTGHTKSCGCIRKPKEKAKSHKFDDYEYYTKIIGNDDYTHLRSAWGAMWRRCKSNYHCHEIYYDRGISVCNEWETFRNFADWAINNGHSKELTLDRIDNDKGYCPDNCRWVTQKVQQNNKRNNIIIEYMGRTQTLKQWCEELNLPYGTIKARRRNGWKLPQLFSAVGV